MIDGLLEKVYCIVRQAGSLSAFSYMHVTSYRVPLGTTSVEYHQCACQGLGEGTRIVYGRRDQSF